MSSSTSPLESLERELTHAAASGEEQRLRALLNRLPPLLLEGGASSGEPIVEAARWNHTGALRLLLYAYGEAAAREDGHIARAVPHAAAAGHLQALQMLLSLSPAACGSSVEDCNEQTSCLPFKYSSDTPLHLAARWGHLSCVEALLAAGAKVDALDSHRRTPLHRASEWGCERTVAALISARACVDSKDASGATPLSIASRCGHTRLLRTLECRGGKAPSAEASSIDGSLASASIASSEVYLVDEIQGLICGSPRSLTSSSTGCILAEQRVVLDNPNKTIVESETSVMCRVAAIEMTVAPRPIAVRGCEMDTVTKPIVRTPMSTNSEGPRRATLILLSRIALSTQRYRFVVSSPKGTGRSPRVFPN
mmetsp:Transcript_29043/g.89015  ORF Transcript_29043/g.89015 Transcript_29043/m.89015 type:complete len:367 (+) Transcript_29043:49-1149(+)